MKQPEHVERPAAAKPNTAPVRERSNLLPSLWSVLIATGPSLDLFDRVRTSGVESRLPRPAPVPAGNPIDPAAVDRALASIGLTRDPDWPVRSCPIASCGSPATVRVVWGPTAALNICGHHRDRITAAATRMQRHVPEFRAITARP